MFVKYLHRVGIIACTGLIVSCFLPWTYHADINQTFTGFYSYQNHYGKPGKLLVFTGALTLVFMLLPKVWAKRANLFICGITFAYAVSAFIRFGSCYNNYCPERLFGIYLMGACTIIMLLASVMPPLKIEGENNK